MHSTTLVWLPVWDFNFGKCGDGRRQWLKLNLNIKQSVKLELMYKVSSESESNSWHYNSVHYVVGSDPFQVYFLQLLLKSKHTLCKHIFKTTNRVTDFQAPTNFGETNLIEMLTLRQGETRGDSRSSIYNIHIYFPRFHKYLASYLDFVGSYIGFLFLGLKKIKTYWVELL